MTALLGVLLLTALPRDSAPVSGDYIEDRTMRVYACPCEWSTDWANRGREAVMAWNVTAGEYGGIALTGARVVAVVVGNFTLTEPDTSRKSAIFVDAAANQRRPAVEWLRSTYPHLLGEVLGVHEVPIDFKSGNDGASVRIAGVLALEMRRARFPEDTQSWAELAHDPFITLADPAVGLTLRLSYTGPDLNARWTRDDEQLTGYFGRFPGSGREPRTR